MKPVHDLHIANLIPLVSPDDIRHEIPFSEKSNTTVFESRKQLIDILSGQDSRMIAIVGPCSIHDPVSAMDYARRLQPLAEKYRHKLLIIMRVYFEKPRTVTGWKGLINDPDLDSSHNVSKGLHLARQLLLNITELGLPTANEMLDPIVPQYISDLVSWAAIGARTTESQTHRELASGLSMPVGFKNGTDGDITIAMNALKSAHAPHHFLGIDKTGRTCIVHTTGNPYGHIILRGSETSPNYSPVDIENAIQQLKKNNLNPGIMVDCSHGNSGKKADRQEHVLKSLLYQREKGNSNIIGFMLESHLVAGQQAFTTPDKLIYGMSITDECIDFETTERLLELAYSKL